MVRKIKVTFAFTVLALAVAAAVLVSLQYSARAEMKDVTVAEISKEMANNQSFTYKGKHSEWVSKLLTRVGGWKCPANASDGGAPPSVDAEECMRDKYVAAAVLYAWAAECYARNEEDSKAADAAANMYKQLQEAQSFCSNAPTVGGGGCDTTDIYKCGEL